MGRAFLPIYCRGGREKEAGKNVLFFSIYEREKRNTASSTMGRGGNNSPPPISLRWKEKRLFSLFPYFVVLRERRKGGEGKEEERRADHAPSRERRKAAGDCPFIHGKKDDPCVGPVLVEGRRERGRPTPRIQHSQEKKRKKGKEESAMPFSRL